MKQLYEHIKPIIALLIVVMSFAYFFINMFNHTKPNFTFKVDIDGGVDNIYRLGALVNTMDAPSGGGSFTLYDNGTYWIFKQ